jgi:predicted permease
MDWHAYVRERLPEITGDAARDEEIVEELAQHVAQRYEEASASGATPAQAFDAAAIQLRDRAALSHLLREADRPRPVSPPPPPTRSASMLSDLWLDVRYAIRLLRRTPAFTAAAVATLALGIGVTIAIFSVIDTVLIRPAPYPDVDRLVMLWETDAASSTAREPASFPDFLDFKARSHTTDRIGAFMAIDGNLQPATGDPMRLAALAVTPEMLEMLGVRPMRGRLLSPSDDVPGAPGPVLISERLWRGAYNGAELVGQSIRINDRPRTVIGIVPTDADFGIVQILRAADYGGGFGASDSRTRVDVWMPLQGDVKRFPRTTHPIMLMARLGPGVAPTAAQDDLTRIASELEQQYRDDNDKRGVSIQPLSQVVFGPVEPPLLVLMAAVALILVMACANVANLLLTRGTRRLREVAMRSALGAETGRLVRQFVAENVVLASAGAAMALVLAFAVLRTLVRIAPAEIPRIAAVGIDMRTLLVAIGCAAFVALVFSLVPVAQTTRIHVAMLLKSEDRVVGGSDTRRLRAVLVIAEVALAVVLVTGAGLLIRSFWNLLATPPGFDVSGTLKADLQLPRSRYPIQNNPMPTSTAIEQFNGALIRRILAIPGAQSAAIAANHPLDGGFASSFVIPRREAEAANWPEISIRRVTPGYFATLRVPLVRGRFLEDRDRASTPGGVVVNQTVMDRVFPGVDPVGRVIGFWGMSWTIVGVVGAERSQGVAKEPPIAVYLPLDAVPASAESLIVRTSGDPLSAASTVRSIIREMDPALVVSGLEPLSETLSKSLTQQRFVMMLLASFACLALVLAAVGIHGVLSCTVAQQRREIGVRMALGADAARVLRSVMAQGAALTAIGLMLGFGLSLALGRFLTGLLFGVTSSDLTTLAGVLVVLAAVAALSIWLPARRAVRVDPLVALRQE